jgi:hypothetical protein
MDELSKLAEQPDFATWSTDDLAAQCRMQAREQLDPEFSRFMEALSDRLAALQSSRPVGGEAEPVAWKWDYEPGGAYSQVVLHDCPEAFGPRWKCTPLFPHPAPSSVSADMVEAGAKAIADHRGIADEDRTLGMMAVFAGDARAVLEAHNEQDRRHEG